ncbi:hypothetical protein D0T53_04760 [Dysgonomonas sp. 216]|uniref:hypothetical protein n=1 Tax=Dysgonomonas sp. 216 TaxID=2302934 RepID=UPI0013D8A398|nr:hypothetical protein [Dysgonomonas sp. 216]NDW18230.1 hypothetical protein [Dysgonomonas sp. 216]
MISDRDKKLSLIKKGIWLYFFLLIFEGAFRKWIIPGLATPLLVVRDPIAIWLICMAWRSNIFKINAYILLAVVVSIISFFTALVYGHGNLSVAMYGVRIMLIHFPLIFVIGRAFSREDILMMGKICVYIGLPMFVLITIQFALPQTSIVNIGVGGEGSSGFAGALGYYRPSGTFSFGAGNSFFWGLLASFVFYFWMSSDKWIDKKILILSTVMLLAAIPISISRTLMFEVLLTLFFMLVYIMRRPSYWSKILIACIGIFIVGLIVYQIPIIQTSIDVYIARFTTASEYEGGVEGTLGNRFLGGMFQGITDSDDLPFWGYGIGMGTNVGAMLLSGKVAFLIAEEEWPRIIGETGLVLGLMTIAIRVVLVFNMGVASFKRNLKGDPLAWMLLSFGCTLILRGQIGQPTALGFFALSGGLIMAALNKKVE